MKPLGNDLFINKSIKKHGNKYDYTLVDYIYNKIKVKIICNIHGEFEQRPNDHLKGVGCSKCKSSKGESIIIQHLENNNVDYIYQYRTKENYIFDFYLENKNIIIEFDGEQHFRPIKHFGGIVAYKKQILQDELKNQYCLNNKINIIRIPYWELNNIDFILNKNLK
jgi:very-short-patch-repair endonuclease